MNKMPITIFNKILISNQAKLTAFDLSKKTCSFKGNELMFECNNNTSNNQDSNSKKNSAQKGRERSCSENNRYREVKVNPPGQRCYYDRIKEYDKRKDQYGIQAILANRK